MRQQRHLKMPDFAGIADNMKSHMTMRFDKKTSNRLLLGPADSNNGEKQLPSHIENALKKNPMLMASKSMVPIR